MRIIIGFFLLIGVELFSQTGPSQPAIGPGGSEYLCASFDSAFYGTNLKEWCWIYEPKTPKLDTAPVIVYWHGYYGGSNYRMLGADMIEYIEHMVKKGYIVIKPVFQYGGSASFSNADGAALLKYAFSILNSGTHVRPSLDEDGNINYGMFGYSNGSKFAFNISNDYAINGIPAPKAIFTTNGNPGSNASNIPSTTKIILLAGAADNLVPQANIENQYNQLNQIPCENKNLYLLSNDYHGTPSLVSNHLFSLTGDGTSGWVNSMDWNAVWKFSVGIMDCATKNKNCDYAFSDADKVTDMGKWSDSVPIKKITIIHPCNPNAMQHNETKKLVVYPNPTSSANMVLNVSGLKEGNLALMIFDVQGRVLFSKNQNVIVNDISLQLENINTGMYILSLLNNEVEHNEKLIVE